MREWKPGGRKPRRGYGARLSDEYYRMNEEFKRLEGYAYEGEITVKSRAWHRADVPTQGETVRRRAHKAFAGEAFAGRSRKCC